MYGATPFGGAPYAGLAPAVVGGGGGAITGSLTVTEPNDTLSALALLRIAGSVVATEPVDTLNASGTITQPAGPIVGALNLTEPNDTLSALAVLRIVGTMATTEPVDTLNASATIGNGPRVGSLNVTEPNDTLSAFGTVAGVAANPLDFEDSSYVVLVEVSAISDLGPVTFYLSDAIFTTLPTDTPANVSFLPYLKDPGRIGFNVYSDGVTGGGTALEYGEIVVTNPDGQFDPWLKHGFDGQTVTVRRGKRGAYPSSFKTVFTAKVDTVGSNLDNFVIRLKDKQVMFEMPGNKVIYLGNNSGVSGYEGIATTIKGKRKNTLFGFVEYISPTPVNSAKQAYQVNDGPVLDIPAVYVSGVQLTQATNYANKADLEGATVAGGTYATCFAEGYFRLGAKPDGDVMADVTEGANAAARTAGQILKRLAMLAGLTTGEISAADVAALDTAQPAQTGYLLDGETTIKQAMDYVANGVGAYYLIDAFGVLRMGRFTAPSGLPVLTLETFDFGEDDFDRKEGKNGNLPIWKVRVKHSRIWAPQKNGIAGSVTEDRKARIGEEFRVEEDFDAPTLAKFALSPTLDIDSPFTNATDALAEASRVLTMQKVQRAIYEGSIPIDLVLNYSLWLMSVVSVNHNRYDLQSGKLLRILGLRFNLVTGRVILVMWG